MKAKNWKVVVLSVFLAAAIIGGGMFAVKAAQSKNTGRNAAAEKKAEEKQESRQKEAKEEKEEEKPKGLGGNYASEENPARAAFENISKAVEEKITAEGYTCEIVPPEGLQAGYFEISKDGEDTEHVNISIRWNEEREEISYMSCDVSDKVDIADIVFSEEGIAGMDDLMAELNEQPLITYSGENLVGDSCTKEIRMFENKILEKTAAEVSLTNFEGNVHEENGYCYAEEKDGAYLFLMQDLPKVIPETLGGLPVIRVGLNAMNSEHKYLAFPKSVREVIGPGYLKVPMVILPSTVERVSAWFFMFTDSGFLVFNPDIEVMDLESLDTLPEEVLNSEWHDTMIIANENPGLRELTDRMNELRLITMEEFRAKMQEFDTENEAYMFDELGEGNYTHADYLFEE